MYLHGQQLIDSFGEASLQLLLYTAQAVLMGLTSGGHGLTGLVHIGANTIIIRKMLFLISLLITFQVITLRIFIHQVFFQMNKIFGLLIRLEMRRQSGQLIRILDNSLK